MENIKDILAKIPILQKDYEYEIQFNDPPSPQDIIELEEDIDVELPVSFRLFLENHNGGFICNGHWAEYIWETGNKDLPRERSLYLFTLDEIREEYEYYWDSIYINGFPFNGLIVPPIPFGRCANGDMLLLREIEEGEPESPVFDGSKGRDHKIRGILFENFTAFFREYIDKMGYVLSFEEHAEMASEKYEWDYLVNIGAAQVEAIQYREPFEKRMAYFSQFLNDDIRKEYTLCLQARSFINTDAYKTRDLCTEALKMNKNNLWARTLKCYALYKTHYDEEARAEWEEIKNR